MTITVARGLSSASQSLVWEGKKPRRRGPWYDSLSCREIKKERGNLRNIINSGESTSDLDAGAETLANDAKLKTP